MASSSRSCHHGGPDRPAVPVAVKGEVDDVLARGRAARVGDLVVRRGRVAREAEVVARQVEDGAARVRVADRDAAQDLHPQVDVAVDPYPASAPRP